MAALHDAAVGHRHPHPGVGAQHRIGAGVFDQRHAAFGEHLFEHRGGVGVLVRQDLIAAGHHRHGDTEFGVGIAELCAGDTGAHDHQVFGQFSEVVELAPVEDSLAVRLGAGQHPGPRAGSDEHHVGLEHTDLAVMGGDLNPVVCHPGHVVDQLGVTGHHSDLLAQQLGADIGGLRAGQGFDAVVDLGERDLGVLDTDVESQARGPA